MTCRDKKIFHGLAVGLFFLTIGPTWAQQHRATHLGNPSTRFADPLQTPEDLRARFENPRLQPDIASILEQASWTGSVEDLIKAARIAEIAEIEIQPGTIMPFMSSRKNGRPITLMEVQWAGKSPTPAYAFYFSSKGRRYRCVTPKACSNFFVEDLGAPILMLECDAPEKVFAGRPALMCVTLRNAGDGVELEPSVEFQIPQSATLTKVAKGGVVGSNKITWELKGLSPQSKVKLCAEFLKSDPGALQVTWKAKGSLAAPVDSQCQIRVMGIPAILLEVVDLSDPIEIGNETTYLIKVHNQGSAADSNIRIVATLSESQEFVSGSGPTAVRASGQTVTMEPLPTLAPEADASWEVVVRALVADDVRFRATLRSAQLDRPVEETESTTQY